MFEPSAQIESLLAAVAAEKSVSGGMRAMMQRQSEFDSPFAAQLTGIALDPHGRAFADAFLDDYWVDQARRQNLLDAVDTDRELIIGSGFHAAVYAAVRVLSGLPKPLVLERHDRPGGTFAMTARPTFYLNSRNRAGNAGLAGDQGSALNYLPGAPIQAANVSMAEYQTNVDMALVIRLTLAQYADVVTGATVGSVTRDGTGVEIDIADRGPLFAARIIDARGLGDPTDQDLANGATICTFPQFMQRLTGRWPLRGLRRVAVIGGGDSGKCAVEALLGIGPAPLLAAAALDTVERVDWYAGDLPTTCDDWQQDIRGRYQAIGRYLRPDRHGAQRLAVRNRRAQPIALLGSALINGRSYDLAVACTGNTTATISGLYAGDFEEYAAPDGTVVARRHADLPAFQIGPHARLPFTQREQADGIADIAANAVAMFRTATKTAALAATLDPATRN
ncbi:hypothetical protein [Paractinoplanes rishiriensis]|uniref:Uncharacterized protein n=1 Tax=Paractinoplanes rishiriensis TaxID=1050105 RepID=A0A919K6S6_9ACTN|nr:hypothetical protein [Actinoplanes rishiriensis]GIF02002.1 hypothetical protein Ari01nite_94660 [Actinoplanes rishiriensis]